MNNYRELLVWKKSINLSIKVYRYTAKFPKEELYGLISQMRRSSISIPSNIAEGSGRSSDKEFVRFLDIAKGSAAELDTQLIIANHLKYLNDINFNELQNNTHEIQKMLFGLKNKLSNQ